MPSRAQRTRILMVAFAVAATIKPVGAGIKSAEAVTFQEARGPFRVKAPEMSIPADAKPGVLRRIIQPFGPWTLICDENMKAHRRVCNVSQILVDPGGTAVFSWSLAANPGGAPVFILRLPVVLAEDHFAQVFFGRKDPVETSVILSTCDAATCLGFLTVDARIQKQIRARGVAFIHVRIGPTITTFEASLDGLDQAVASLK